MGMDPLSAGIMAGGSVLSGVLGGKGAKKAAKAEVQMGREALALQKQMYDQGRADLAPWRDAGGKAIGQGFAMLQPGYDYTASPGYDFRLSEGLRGVENSAAARGLLQSGGTLKGIDKYAEGLAAQDYNDQFNRMMSVASGGQQAATSSVQAGQNYASGASNTLGNIGQAKASGYAGVSQAAQGTLGNLMDVYMWNRGY
jgi:hypothetical protein